MGLYGRVYDVAIIGGGLIGTAIARDAAGRGLSVFLCEEGDLGGVADAGAVSVYGGIEHLAALRFGAMREAVAEREILMRSAPHLARPLTLVIPHHERQWTLRALRLGLFALDHAAQSSLPRSRTASFDDREGPLQRHFTSGVAYSDCAVDDGRLAVHSAMDARSRGAEIYPRLRCTIAERDGGEWRLSLESTIHSDRYVVAANLLVNAAGGRAADVRNHVAHGGGQVRVRLTKLSWLAVRQAGFGDVAYALPSADGQIVYALPIEGDTVLLGPFSSPYHADAGSARVEAADADYLVDVTEQYFRVPFSPTNIVRAFAKVTALPVEALPGAESAIVVDAPPLVAPLISVFGGNVAVHRRLAEDVVDRIGGYRKVAPGWTGTAVLPGGGYPRGGERDMERALSAAYPFISDEHAARLVRAYGTKASAVLTGARCASNLGRRFGADLTEAEVKYLCEEEWAQTAEDVLWRRSRLGLSLSAGEAASLDGWLGEGTASVG